MIQMNLFNSIQVAREGISTKKKISTRSGWFHKFKKVLWNLLERFHQNLQSIVSKVFCKLVYLIQFVYSQDLVMHSCRKLVEHVGFFQNLPLPLIVRIVSSLATEIFMVNDVIIKVNTPGTCMYFIASGCVAMYTRNGYEVKKFPRY